MSSTASSAERPAGRGASRRRLSWPGWVSPVALFCLYALTSPGLPRGDAAAVYVTAAALAEHGGLQVDGFLTALASQLDSDDASAYPIVAYSGGHYYHVAPPGRALVAAPLYLAGELLAPLAGAEAPLGLITLLGPLCGALALALLWQRARRCALSVRWQGPLLMGAALLLWPLARTFNVALVVTLSAIILVPLLPRFWNGATRPLSAAGAGALLGAVALFEYAAGALALALALVLAGRLLRRRAARAAGGLLVMAALGPALLALWQWRILGQPWRLAYRAAIDSGARSLQATTRAIWSGGVDLPPLRPTLPVWTPASFSLPTLASLALMAILLVGIMLLVSRVRLRGIALALLLSPGLILSRPHPIAAAEQAANYLPPFAIAVPGGERAVWSVQEKESVALPGELHLVAGTVAVSPWIVAQPGVTYALSGDWRSDLTVTVGWETAARQPVLTQTQLVRASRQTPLTFAAPVGAAGLRITLAATAGAAVAGALRLTLVAGTRVEPFPDGRRAALAFSFDWESAMGGLIHSRSGADSGEPGVGLRADGGPSVMEAEEKGLRMREGARFLADLFARYGIHATFYATGYDLLPGNPSCTKFVGDPTYRNVNVTNGWASDWWRSHPWYGDDPCSTEAEAPAWYFASQSRQLALEGHEIASHSFGHLYVRGVTPEQLRDDLAQWNQSAQALGLPPARSFAFPWTSSNSLDERFWVVFEHLGMTVLTRIYPQNLRHPYELDRIPTNPALVVFPDYYLASNTQSQTEAMRRIDLTLASRGYHSLWDHPNEALEQSGPAVWPAVIDHAAAQRDRGLWIAPVSDIAGYAAATDRVAVTALPVAGGTRLVVTNRSSQTITGLTLGLPAGTRAAALPGGALPLTAEQQCILPPVGPAMALTVRVER